MSSKTTPQFSPVLIGAVAAGILLLILGFNSCIVIDAGEVGVGVTFGKVQESPYLPGINFKLPFITNVYKYSTRIQKYEAQQLDAKGRDIVQVKIDLTVNWKIDEQRVFDVYKNYGTNVQSIEEKSVIPFIREAIRSAVSNYDATSIIGNQKELNKMINDHLTEKFKTLPVLLNDVSLRQIMLPERMQQAVDEKLARQQEIERAEAEKKIKEIQAEQRVIEAEGIAKSQQIIQSRLTPLYVQWYAVETYKELANSENTTFVIMPTDPRGTGMPLILNTK